MREIEGGAIDLYGVNGGMREEVDCWMEKPALVAKGRKKSSMRDRCRLTARRKLALGKPLRYHVKDGSEDQMAH
ncbi:hypothetical protein GW17_00052428 [Ensete ventricosum]|nr:hypothetical protein GW17_00052428 [Ensete ventricosum]RZS20580.1 hypothetical protein BHM03_00053139 [Ensete ventricosum]